MFEDKWSRFQRDYNIDLQDEVSADVDLSNYYTKTEVDSIVDGIESGGADLSNYYTKTQVDSTVSSLDTRLDAAELSLTSKADAAALSDKADLSLLDNYHTAEEVDTALAGKANTSALSVYYTSQTVDGLLADKADGIDLNSLAVAVATKADATALSNYYTKTEYNISVSTLIGMIDEKADIVDVYTKTETDNLINAKAALTVTDALDGRLDAAESNITSIFTTLNNKVNTSTLSNYYTQSQVDSALSNKVNTSALSSYYTKTEIDNQHQTVNTEAELLTAVAAGGTIVVDSSSQITLTQQLNVTVAGTRIRGGRFYRSTGTAIYITASDVVIEGAEFLGGRDANNTYDTTQKIVYAKGTSSAKLSNVHVRNCKFRQSRGDNIWFEWCVDSSANNNDIANFLYSGVMVISGLRIQVNNNVIYDAPLTGSVLNVYGIAFTDSANTIAARSTDCQAVGNVVSYIDWEGIDTHGGSGITITGNTVSSCPRGIALVVGNETRVTAPTRCTVTGNTIDGAGVRQAIRDGIIIGGIAGVSADGTITGNHISNYSGGNPLLVGSYLDRGKTYIGQNSHPMVDWTNITLDGDFNANGTYTPQFKIDGNTVYLRGGVIPKTATSTRSTIGHIPSGYAFPSALAFVGYVKGSNAAAGNGMVAVNTDGTVQFSYFSGTDQYTYFLSGTYEAI